MALAHGHHRDGARGLRRPARVLRRIAGTPRCPQCNDTGSVWVVCPDAGAVKLPCACGQVEAQHGIGLVDVGLATAFVVCCGAAVLLL